MHRPRPRLGSLLPALVAAAALAGLATADEDRVVEGQRIFKDEGCPQCHGFGGKGDGYLLRMIKEPVRMRDWTDPEAMQGLDDAYLAEITRRGGEALGKSKVMLKYGHKLDEEQIRAIVVFIRSLAR